MKWIRLWTEETIFGSTFEELDAEMRGIWFSLLPLAGIGAPPVGSIKVCDDWGYTNQQLAAMIKVDEKILERALKRLVEVNKISISPKNIITIVNWSRFQTEYDRQKKYRGLHKIVTPDGYTDELQGRERVEGEVEGEEEEDVDKKKKKSDSKIDTLSKLESKKDEVIENAYKLYSDKECKKAMEDFIEACKIKGYKYKAYDLAYYRWVREDRFNQYKKKLTPQERVKDKYKNGF